MSIRRRIISRFIKAMLVIILTVTLGLGFLWANGGLYDAYKQPFGDAKWHTNLKAFTDQVGKDITNLTDLISNWVGTNNFLMLIEQTPTYASGDTFTTQRNYTNRLSVGKKIQVDLGTDGGVTTVNLNAGNLASNLKAIYVAATRDGNWPKEQGFAVGVDYGSPSRQSP